MRVLSGVQPTGNLHLGNYLGAIRNWVAMQDTHECLFMLADLHAITVPIAPEKLRQSVRETAAAYIACGIDPRKSVIFPQSAVSGHAELAWVLSCHTPLGWLNRMTQFKEKAGITNLLKDINTQIKELEKKINNDLKQMDEYISKTKVYTKKLNEYSTQLESQLELAANIRTLNIDTSKRDEIEKPYKEFCDEYFERVASSRIEIIQQFLTLIGDNKSIDSAREKVKLGLLSYPVLMAADILLYKATHVPTGEDQKQHLELSRDIAGAFNRAYKQDFFPLPEPMILGSATRVMSLRDGKKKMSKSDESDYSRITLLDDSDTIAKKIKKATSDMLPGITYDPETRPEASNLLNIYAALAGITREQAEDKFRESQFSAFKQELADVAVAHLAPISTKMRELLSDTWELDNMLVNGASKANNIAKQTFSEVKEMVGFLKV